MKLPFVIDDCVYQHAVAGVNAEGAIDTDASDFFVVSFRACHRIVQNDGLRKKFYSVLKPNADQSVSHSAVKALKGFTQRPEKLIYVPDQQVDPRLLEGIPKEDHYVIQAAIALLNSDSGVDGVARVVTSDTELIDGIKANRLLVQAKVVALTVPDALELVSEF